MGMEKNSNNLVTSIKRGIGGTFTFSGKSNRFEYITYFIFLLSVYFGSLFLLIVADLESIIWFWSIFAIFVAISLTTLMARRLGDMGHSKWVVILAFIPIIGIPLPFYLMIFKSKKIIVLLLLSFFPFVLYILNLLLGWIIVLPLDYILKVLK